MQPCPDPSGGQDCSAGQISCFDVTGTIAPAPAMSTGGLLILVVLITAVGCLTVARRRLYRR